MGYHMPKGEEIFFIIFSNIHIYHKHIIKRIYTSKLMTIIDIFITRRNRIAKRKQTCTRWANITYNIEIYMKLHDRNLITIRHLVTCSSVYIHYIVKSEQAGTGNDIGHDAIIPLRTPRVDSSGKQGPLSTIPNNSRTY